MYENIFKRVEEKYLLTKEEYNNLMKEIEKELLKDTFFKTTICNIYFDTSNNDIVINSIEKPIYKHKIRLRSYGIPSLNDDVYLEIKSKYKGVVSKRRIKLSLKQFNRYINKNIYNKSNQIMKEIDYLFKLYNLKPKYFIAYDRLSYKGKNDDNLRITFDSNLRSRCEDLSLEYGDYGKLYFSKETYIMEIKTLGAMPLWLVRTLSNLNIKPVSFSKYGKIYSKKMEELC